VTDCLKQSGSCLMAPGCPDHVGKTLLHAIQVSATHRDCYYSDGTVSQTSTLKPIPDYVTEAQLIRDAIVYELGATRTLISSERELLSSSLGSSTASMQTTVHARASEFISRSEEVEGSLVVSGLAFMLVLGLFFGWKALGRGAGRSG